MMLFSMMNGTKEVACAVSIGDGRFGARLEGEADQREEQFLRLRGRNDARRENFKPGNLRAPHRALSCAAWISAPSSSPRRKVVEKRARLLQ
ncbi:hypothetical protein [Bradyrhizobium sp. JYMT SZCCT0428]|uniref:hypothetical protein n=1 Tax=Bradyrhizobium sp. JYMT SZCCT0428 TaxID=2807673 RepID=UPI00289F9BA3|nr:hypothetical protein [Bradyrhizobium sp. JYMT SZCCT0428]